MPLLLDRYSGFRPMAAMITRSHTVEFFTMGISQGIGDTRRSDFKNGLSCSSASVDTGYVKSLVYADKPQTLDYLEDNIRRVIADIRPQMLKKSSKIGRPDWNTSEPAVAVICQKSYLKLLRISKKFGNPCPLDEDDLMEFMTVYDDKEVYNIEVDVEVQLLTVDLIRKALKFATKGGTFVYTDGSKDEDPHSSSGILIKDTNGIVKMKKRNPNFSSVFEVDQWRNEEADTLAKVGAREALATSTCLTYFDLYSARKHIDKKTWLSSLQFILSMELIPL
ncbi:hypothetical protein TNCV_2666671 [Trichonephila clavipes]|nr:hypothetical protein TNCV_2666671 [Trichonephila clavipes]